jgi:hypothetical protein
VGRPEDLLPRNQPETLLFTGTLNEVDTSLAEREGAMGSSGITQEAF